MDELYPTLATTITPSPYKVTQEDIDAALQQWNGRIESKHAVVRYMKLTPATGTPPHGWHGSTA